MAFAHGVVLAAALLTLLCLPCAVTALVCVEEPMLSRLWTRPGRAESRALRRLDRALAEVDAIPALDRAEGPSLEEIVVDLRRLDRQRRTGPTRESRRWLTAVTEAYDVRLSLACRRLGLSEHLRQLQGLDRDIERVRVEGQLEAAGLTLRA